MCDTCGCGLPGEKAIIRVPGENTEKHDDGYNENLHNHSHPHSHDHGTSHHHHNNGDTDDNNGQGHSHEHDHDHVHNHDHNEITRRTVNVETDILLANNLMAERNRGIFEAKNLTVINLMSSPGSGKTTLLERTINELKGKVKFSVIEGDQQTMNDAERIKVTGVPVVQVNTGNGCHLDSEMINRAVKRLAPEDGSVILIENVGNLVCPSLFDLGEDLRVVIMSLPEGEDKPLKYPNMFRSVSVCLLNKIDLLPYLDFDVSKAVEYGRQVNPKLRFIELSAKSGEGMEQWYEWIIVNCGQKSG
jgi:hydrogenase nickel incorporation protein HypB